MSVSCRVVRGLQTFGAADCMLLFVVTCDDGVRLEGMAGMLRFDVSVIGPGRWCGKQLEGDVTMCPWLVITFILVGSADSVHRLLVESALGTVLKCCNWVLEQTRKYQEN